MSAEIAEEIANNFWNCWKNPPINYWEIPSCFLWRTPRDSGGMEEFLEEFLKGLPHESSRKLSWEIFERNPAETKKIRELF